MQPLTRSIDRDQIIVADPRERVAANISRVHDDIHVLFDTHRLVLANEPTFDKVVALTVA